MQLGGVGGGDESPETNYKQNFARNLSKIHYKLEIGIELQKVKVKLNDPN